MQLNVTDDEIKHAWENLVTLMANRAEGVIAAKERHMD